MTICKCQKLPDKNCYIDAQFSRVKKRRGMESAPFLGLNEGVHLVKFETERKSIVREVKIWISIFGWAWIILKPHSN